MPLKSSQKKRKLLQVTFITNVIQKHFSPVSKQITKQILQWVMLKIKGKQHFNPQSNVISTNNSNVAVGGVRI